jgi:hypothetical protein
MSRIVAARLHSVKSGWKTVFLSYHSKVIAVLYVARISAYFTSFTSMCIVLDVFLLFLYSQVQLISQVFRVLAIAAADSRSKLPKNAFAAFAQITEQLDLLPRRSAAVIFFLIFSLSCLETLLPALLPLLATSALKF